MGVGSPKDYLDSAANFDTIARMRADLLSSIRFFKKNAGNYKIDIDNIWLLRFSGGGPLSLTTANLDENDLTEYIPEFVDAINEHGGIEGDGGNKGYDSSVKGVISLAGFIYTAAYIDEGEPISLNIRGKNDPAHPLECSIVDLPWGPPFEYCGAKAIKNALPGNEFYEPTIDPADAMATVDHNQCPECDDMIVDFIYERLGY